MSSKATTKSPGSKSAAGTGRRGRPAGSGKAAKKSPSKTTKKSPPKAPKTKKVSSKENGSPKGNGSPLTKAQNRRRLSVGSQKLERVRESFVKTNDRARDKRSADTQPIGDGIFTAEMLDYTYGKLEGQTQATSAANRCRDFMKALEDASRNKNMTKIVNPNTGRSISLLTSQKSNKKSPTLLKLIRDCSKHAGAVDLPADLTVATKDVPLDLENELIGDAASNFFRDAANSSKYRKVPTDPKRLAEFKAKIRTDLRAYIMENAGVGSITSITGEEMQRICDFVITYENMGKNYQGTVQQIFFLFYEDGKKNEILDYYRPTEILDDVQDLAKKNVILHELKSNKGPFQRRVISAPKFGSAAARAVFVNNGLSYYTEIKQVLGLGGPDFNKDLAALHLYKIYNENAGALAAAKAWSSIRERVLSQKFGKDGELKKVAKGEKMVAYDAVMRSYHTTNKFFNPYNVKVYNVSKMISSDAIGMMEQVQSDILEDILRML